MDFKALEEKVQVPGKYCIKFSDLVKLNDLAKEKGTLEVLYIAFLAGWQKCENKRKDDARSAAHQAQG